MQAIRTDFKPQNRITTPLARNSCEFASGVVSGLQYGDKVIVDSLEAMRRTKINSRSTFYRKLKRVQ